MAVNSRTHKLYVVHPNHSKVDVIDSLSGTLLRSLDLSGYTRGYDYLGKIAVNENTNTLYLGSGSSSLLVLDGNSDTVIKVITGVSTFPEGIGVNPYTGNVTVAAINVVYWIDGNTSSNPPYSSVGTMYNPVPQDVVVNPFTNIVYVTLFNEQTCVAIDGTSHQVMSRIPVGAQPRGMALNPWTNTIYVASEDEGLSVINGNTHSVVAQLHPKTSWGSDAVLGPIAVNYRTNRIYLTGSNNDILVIDGATNQQIAAVDQTGDLVDLVVDSETNRVFVTDYDANHVTIYSDNAPSIAAPPRIVINAPADGSVIRRLPTPLTGQCENNLGASNIQSVQWQLTRVSPSSSQYWDAVASTWVSTSVLNSTTPNRPGNSSVWYSAGSIPQDNSTTGGPNNLPPGSYALTAYGNDGTHFVSRTHRFAVVGAEIVKSASQVTSENGHQSTFEIKLSSRPAATVSFDVTSSNPQEGAVVPSSVVFTPDNWNQPHPVTILGVDDQIVDGPRNYQIVVSPSRSEDPVFAGLTVAALDFTNLDNDVPSLRLVTSSQNITEGGTLTGSVTHDTPVQNALTVTLHSNHAGVLIPQSVTIPAGSATASFNIQITDDQTASGNSYATLTATAGNLSNGAIFHIIDNDIARLELSLSANSVTEGGRLTATLTRNTPTGEPLAASLHSNREAVMLPQTVVIPAGTTSLDIPIDTLDDGVAAGSHNVSITATAGVLSATQTLSITDAQRPQLTLSLSSSSIAENTGLPVWGTVTRNTPTAGPLTVTLFNSDMVRLRMPTTITIGAGGTSASFAISVVDNAVVDSVQESTIRAQANDLASATAMLRITDDDKPQLKFNPAANYIPENGAITVWLSHNLRQNPQALTVNLTASANGQLNIPATVTMTARAGTIAITVRGVDNTLAEGPRLVTLTARALGFTPASTEIALGDNEAASNGHVRGKVLLAPSQGTLPVPGALLELRRGTTLLSRTTSATDGSYIFYNLPRGSYTVTPTRGNYTFSPASRIATLPSSIGMAALNIDFVGTPRAQIAGQLTRRDATGKVQPLAGATVLARGALQSLTARTNSLGHYVFDRVPLGLYNITPVVPGTVFNPRFRTIVVNAALPVKMNVDFAVAATDAVLPSSVLVRTPAANVTDAQKSTLTATGTASDNTGGSGIAFVTVSIARFTSATATTPNGFYHWSGRAFIAADNSLWVEALATGTTTWSLNGAALTGLRSLPAGFYGVRATAVDNAGNLKRSTWKRFAITSTTRGVDEEEIATVNPTSPVRLSTARAATDRVELILTGALEVASATEVANFTVQVNGSTVEVESLSYARNTIVISLPESTLRAGDEVLVQWNNLRDAQGRVLASPEVRVVVR
jgi:DNA-binding beta-propeller fold protein YncE